MGKTALFWVDGNWQSLEVDNADNLDGKDSLDFSLVGHKHFKSEITDLPGNVTTTQDGFMSVSDKIKLNGIAVNANNYTHPNDVNTRHVTDSQISTWNAKVDINHGHAISSITGLQTELDNLKSSVSNGKTLVASTITGKGIAATGSETFEQLANKINQIQSFSSKQVLYEKIFRASIGQVFTSAYNAEASSLINFSFMGITANKTHNFTSSSYNILYALSYGEDTRIGTLMGYGVSKEWEEEFYIYCRQPNSSANSGYWCKLVKFTSPTNYVFSYCLDGNTPATFIGAITLDDINNYIV